MIHYTQIIWEEVAFIWKVTGKVVAIFMTGTVCTVYEQYSVNCQSQPFKCDFTTKAQAPPMCSLISSCDHVHAHNPSP